MIRTIVTPCCGAAFQVSTIKPGYKQYFSCTCPSVRRWEWRSEEHGHEFIRHSESGRLEVVARFPETEKLADAREELFKPLAGVSIGPIGPIGRASTETLSLEKLAEILDDKRRSRIVTMPEKVELKYKHDEPTTISDGDGNQVFQNEGVLRCSCHPLQKVLACDVVMDVLRKGLDSILFYSENPNSYNQRIMVPMYSRWSLNGYQYPYLPAEVRMMVVGANSNVRAAVLHPGHSDCGMKDARRNCSLRDSLTGFSPLIVDAHPWGAVTLGMLGPGEGRAVLARLIAEQVQDALMPGRAVLTCSAPTHLSRATTQSAEKRAIREGGNFLAYWNWAIFYTGLCPDDYKLLENVATDYPDDFDKK